MKKFRASPPLVALAFAVAATAAAGESGTAAPHGRGGPGHFQMQNCLSALNLPAEQHAAIQSILTEGKVTLGADRQALKSLHQKMQADIAGGADKAVLGQDVLDQDAARTKMKDDMKAIHDQVLAQLLPDQQATFNTCMAAAKTWHSRPTPATTQ
jgi:Spy/CpxP family protein refolding chaperone